MSRIQCIKRVCVVLVVALCLIACLPLTVKADVTVTQTFYSNTSDGHITASSGTYVTAYNAATGTVSGTATTFNIGQKTGYDIWRGFVYFDTFELPDSATITAAVLSLYISTDMSTTNFNVQIQSGMPTYPHDPQQTNDYLYSQYSGDGGNRGTDTISATGYWNITLSATGRGWITKTSTTKLCLRNSKDISSTAPTNEEYIIVKSREAGTSNAPILYVTFTATGTYTYTIYGPYTDAPVEVYNGTTNLQIFSGYADSETATLDGSTGEADVLIIIGDSQPLMLTWNISTGGNYSRAIFISEITETIYIFVPNENTPVSMYEFPIIDFQGVTNGYLESRLYYNGEYRTVERHVISTINSVSMYLQWAAVYNMRLICDQGTLDMGAFTALGVTSNNIVIPYGAFPSDATGNNATVAVVRMNSTWIQMNFTDPDSLTDWVHLEITHKVGSSYVSDYTANNTGASIQVNWYSAVAGTDYLANVTFLRDSSTFVYMFSCPAPSEITNPWNFISEPYCYAIAVSLTIAVGLVFSYATIVGGAWSMVGFALFFTAIGWLPQTTGTYVIITFGGLISSLITIAEWKKVERDI